MKKVLGISLVAATVILASACKKSCIVDDTYVGSAIVFSDNDNNGANDVMVIPKSGYMTSNFGGNMKIDANHPWAGDYEVSFDGGRTKQPVDYNTYVIFADPQHVPCNASIERKVEVGPTSVVYTVSVTNDCASRCADENNEYYLENYILCKKSALPGSYQFIYK